MRKFTFVSSLLVFMAPAAVLAQVTTPGSQGTGSQCINFANNLLKTANILVTLLFVVALLVFAYGIIRFLFAAGDPAKVSQSKGYILWGVIGMAVLASLFGLIIFLRSVFGISNDKGNIAAPAVTGSTVTGGTVGQ